jgi:phosphatidylglycerophosphate synthase
MSRPSPLAFFKQSLKSESYYADEIINIYLMRPLAAVVVWFLYPTSITPNQVTIFAVLIGFAAAAVYTDGAPTAIAFAGLLVTAKDICDDADGQLARAKQLYSRRGRFLDSLGDIAVDVALFSAITFILCKSHPTLFTIFLGIAGLFGITLRVSYHVYYQASFLHLEDRYMQNRIIERVTVEDKHGDLVALRLQILFNIVYGWQDYLMYRIDTWCKGNFFSD